MSLGLTRSHAHGALRRCAQMLMERFIMLKMFMGAAGASATSLAVISMVAPDKFEKARAKARAPFGPAGRGRLCACALLIAAPPQVSGCKKRFRIAGLGAGAAGPGARGAQPATPRADSHARAPRRRPAGRGHGHRRRVPRHGPRAGGLRRGHRRLHAGGLPFGARAHGSSHVFTWPPCLTIAPLERPPDAQGALLHALAEPHLVRASKEYATCEAEGTFLDKKLLPGKPYAALALPLAAGCGLAVLVLESLFPWRAEALAVIPRTVGAAAPRLGLGAGLAAAAWPPQLGGAVIGALQLPLVLYLGNTLGTSSSYVTAISCVVPDAPDRVDLKSKRGPANFWQLAFVTGGVLGAAFSAAKSGTAGAVRGLHPGLAYAGGAALVFGSRAAGGCTSGHGISGFSLLSAASAVAMPCMFGGGIATAFAMRAAGALLQSRSPRAAAPPAPAQPQAGKRK
jgi:hypothetical protein